MLYSSKIMLPKSKAILSGVRSAVNGTPSFFINGQQHQGTYALDDLAPAIEQHLHAKVSL